MLEINYLIKYLHFEGEYDSLKEGYNLLCKYFHLSSQKDGDIFIVQFKDLAKFGKKQEEYRHIEICPQGNSKLEKLTRINSSKIKLFEFQNKHKQFQIEIGEQKYIVKIKNKK